MTAAIVDTGALVAFFDRAEQSVGRVEADGVTCRLPTR